MHTVTWFQVFLIQIIFKQFNLIPITGWNDKIVAPEKTTWFHFRLMKTGFLFLLQTIYLLSSCVQIPRVTGAFYHVWKWHNVQQAGSEMRHCTTMLSANPTYDYRTIATTLKMQIKTVQRLRAQLNTPDDPLEVVEQKDTARKTQTKEFIEKVQAIIDDTPQRPTRQIARDLSVSHTTVKVCVKEDLKCRSYRRQTSQILTEKTNNLRLIKSVKPPPPLTWTRWTTSFGHMSRTSQTWPPTTPKPAWLPPSAEYSLSFRWRL